MAKLSQATGMSQAEFAALIKDNPTEAFFKFLDVLKRMNADGQNISGFLEEFQLQGEESIKVLGTAGVQLDLFKQKVRDAKGEAAKGTALDKEYAQVRPDPEFAVHVLQNNVKLLGKNIGMGLAPVIKTAVASPLAPPTSSTACSTHAPG